MDTDLSLEDVEFLRTVREINANPEGFENTDEGEMPATTSAIRTGSRLDREQVKYRAKPSDTLDGLVTVHEAEFDPDSRMFGPKSVELTERGEEVLASYEDDYGGSESIARLEARIDQLENADFGDEVDAATMSAELSSIRGSLDELRAEIDELSSEVEAVREAQSGEWGAIDDEIVDPLESILEQTPAVLYLFDALFGVEVKPIAESGAFDEGERKRVQSDVFEQLSAAAEVASDEPDSQGGLGEFEDAASNIDGGGSDSTSDGEASPASITKPSVESDTTDSSE
jgi:hypothetical protein